MKTALIRNQAGIVLVTILFIVLASSCTPSIPFMMMNPPPDSDKPLPVPAGDNSCWMHTASNMLAAAGYGNGTTVQARADDIFADMATVWTANDGVFGGWTDSALTWWLGSANNTWSATNPYTLVTPIGNTDCNPWNDANGSLTIANHLRAMEPVGLAIRWPWNEPAGTAWGCQGGHAITAMGDDTPSHSTISTNPTSLRITDSDTDAGGDVQSYLYDAFTSPNPGGPNEGNGWYFNYSNNHPYLIQIVTLTRTTAGAGAYSVLVDGSYKIQQMCDPDATDLHYIVGTDTTILTYQTWLDVPGTPTITEAQPRDSITVDWTLDKPIPRGEWVTINTEFVERIHNAIFYDDVHFTYSAFSGPCMSFAPIGWEMDSPLLENAENIPNITGGFVVGRFDIVNNDHPELPPIQYRFQHQYLYNQNPEFHALLLTGAQGYSITNLMIGHSYGHLTEQQMWEFKKWMTIEKEPFKLSKDPITIEIDWKGRLPYPEGLK
jgi:hypothetical protein